MMKRLILITTIIVAGLLNAASVDWKITGEKTDIGTTVYLITTLATSYESADQLIASAVSQGTISTKGRQYAFLETSTSDTITAESMANAYLVIINNNTTYTYIGKSLANYVYDVNQQETSKGFFSVNVSDIMAGTQAQFVPEPTSGLLILLGMAGLALRRRRV